MLENLLAAAIASTLISLKSELSKSGHNSAYYGNSLDLNNITARIDSLLKNDKLSEALGLINVLLEIDKEAPIPYAQLGRYYELKAESVTGDDKIDYFDKSISSYKDALQLAYVFTPGKVEYRFTPKVSQRIGVVLNSRANFLLNNGDIFGSMLDMRAALEHNLPDDLKKCVENLLVSLR
jgi:hypothetical protein